MKGWRVQPQYYYKLPQIYQDLIDIEQYANLEYQIVRDQLKLTLDKENFLRLADLHFLLNIQYRNEDCIYTQLYPFQVLQVIRMIAEHLYLIKQKELVHKNLNKLNIWIRFGQNNLKIYCQKELQIEQIYFVNYDPNENKSQTDFQSIQTIFKEFLDNLTNKEVKNVILDKIPSIVNTQSLMEFIDLVKQYEIALKNDQFDEEQNLQTIPELDQPFQNQSTNQTQQSRKFLGFSLPNIGLKQKLKTYFKGDESKSPNDYSSCMSRQINFQIKNENQQDERLKELKERLFQHQLDYLYKEQFKMFAYDFKMNQTISNDQTINGQLKLTFDNLESTINKIFKGMGPDFEQLDSFTQQMDYAFQSEFKMDLDMKGVDKQIYCDLLYQWLVNDVEDLYHIFDAKLDEIKPDLMRRSKTQYKKIHKDKFELAVQQLINQLF